MCDRWNRTNVVPAVVRWGVAAGAAAAASMVCAQQAPSPPPVSQAWIDRQFQFDGQGQPVNGADEATDAVFYHYVDPTTPGNNRRWVYATGYVTEANGASRFLTMKYNADWPEFNADPLVPVPRRPWPPGEVLPAGQVNKAIAMTRDSDGNIYIAGESTDQDAGQMGVDYVVLKYDKDLNQATGGAPTWTYRYDGPAHGNDRPTDIVVDLDQPRVVFVTGTSWNGTDNDIVTIAIDATDGVPCPLWPANALGPAGVRRYHAGGEDLAVELAGPYLACFDSGGSRNCADPMCELQVAVLGTSWDPTTQTFDMVTFKYGDDHALQHKGVKLWEQRWIGGGDQNETATGLAWTGTGMDRLIALGYGPPLSTTSTGGAGSFSFGPPEPNHDYHLVVYDYITGEPKFWDTVDLTGLPDYSADVQAAPWGNYQFILWAAGRATSGAAFDAGTVQWTWTRAQTGIPESLTRNWVALYDVLAGRDDRGINAAYEVFSLGGVGQVVAGYVTGSSRGGSVTNDDALTLKYPQTPAPPTRPPTWGILHAGASGGEDAGRAICVGDQDTPATKSSVYLVGKSFQTNQNLDFIVIRYKQN